MWGSLSCCRCQGNGGEDDDGTGRGVQEVLKETREGIMLFAMNNWEKRKEKRHWMKDDVMSRNMKCEWKKILFRYRR